jgi:c-di-GMP-binding flagellar brake protein YcgR
MHNEQKRDDRRNFLRVDYEKPVHYSMVSSPKDDKAMTSLFKAVSKNLSASGLLFLTNAEKVPEISSLIMIDLDYKTANICHEIERRALIKNNKLLGRVMRIEDNGDGTCGVGVAFVTKSNRLSEDVRNIT